MVSSEIVCRDNGFNNEDQLNYRGQPVGYVEDVLIPARAGLDMTLIFAPHGDAADALATTAHIAPNSIVFLEGIGGIDRTGMNSTMFYYTQLQLGDEASVAHYNDTKQEVVESLRQDVKALGQADEEKELFQYPEYTLTLFAELIEKDCICYPADAPETDSFTLRTQELSYRAGISPGEVTEYISGIVALRSEESRHILSRLRQFFFNSVVANGQQHYRESIAVFLCDTVALKMAHPETQLEARFKTSVGRPRSYTVYGSAHMKSLSSKMQYKGYSISDIIHEPLLECLYIPEQSTGQSISELYAKLGTIAFVHTLQRVGFTQEEVAQQFGFNPVLDVSLASNAIKLFDRFLQYSPGESVHDDDLKALESIGNAAARIALENLQD